VTPQALPALPLKLWQLAAPTLFALFLALIAIRSDVDTSDAFTRFWSRVLSNRHQIMVEVDASGDGKSIAPAMAEAAMPLSLIGTSFQVPIHMSVATNRPANPGVCVIRLSTGKEPPDGAREWQVAGVRVIYQTEGGPVLWLAGKSPEDIGHAVRSLSAHSAFPEIRIDPVSELR
jgi:hypothetical protein